MPAEPEELRAKAAISLGPVLEQSDIEMGDDGEFDDPDDVPISEKTFRKIQQSLRKVYLDTAVPKLTRRRILEAAVRAPEDWQTQAIRTAYASDDPEWKLTAVFCMRYVRGFEKQILEALESPDPKIHYEAISAAGNWEVDAAWPHVTALLESQLYQQGPAACRYRGRGHHPPARGGSAAGGPGRFRRRRHRRRGR